MFIILFIPVIMFSVQTHVTWCWEDPSGIPAHLSGMSAFSGPILPSPSIPSLTNPLDSCQQPESMSDIKPLANA